MNMPYKQVFPWGERTHFEEKIRASQALIKTPPVISYEAKWVPKIHTIREDKGDRWHRGRGQFLKIHHAYGVRTKEYRCFLVTECTGVQDIEIMWERAPEGSERLLPSIIEWHGRIPRLYIDSIEVGLDTMLTVAKNDGFNSATDFFRWFKTDFAGKIIHWTDFRYTVDAKKVEEAYKVSLPAFSSNDLQTLLNL